MAAIVCSLPVAAANLSATPCHRIKTQRDQWVVARVNTLVRAARAAYENEKQQQSYERVVDQIAGGMKRCGVADDPEFVESYPEFTDYVRLLLLARRDDHELGFEVSDKVYFAETSQYTTIPDFLLTPRFLSSVSRFETLSHAKALLREMNAGRTADDKLLFFSYSSRHLGTPDNPDSYRRLLIVVPGNPAQQVPEKWVQFGIADPGRPRSVRNVSVVAVVPVPDHTTNVYFKDYFRTYRRHGAITIKGRWELGEGDDNCVSCHKSGVLPIFPVAGSVTRDEQAMVETVNKRFETYLPAHFGRYIDTSRFGPGLGSRAYVVRERVEERGQSGEGNMRFLSSSQPTWVLKLADGCDAD